jgi:hypothetical protein
MKAYILRKLFSVVFTFKISGQLHLGESASELPPLVGAPVRRGITSVQVL